MGAWSTMCIALLGCAYLVCADPKLRGKAPAKVGCCVGDCPNDGCCDHECVQANVAPAALRGCSCNCTPMGCFGCCDDPSHDLPPHVFALVLGAEPLPDADLQALHTALMAGVSGRRLAEIPSNLLTNVEMTGSKDGVATAATAESIQAVVAAWPIPEENKAEATQQFETVLVTEQSTEFQTFKLLISADAATGAYSFVVGASRKVEDGVQVGYVYSTATGTLVQQTEIQHREWSCCKVNLFGICVDNHTCSEDETVNRGNTAEEVDQIATALQQSAEEYAVQTLGGPAVVV